MCAYPRPSGRLRGRKGQRSSIDAPHKLLTVLSLWDKLTLPLSCCFPVVKIKALTVSLRMRSSLVGLLCRLFPPFILPSANQANYQVPVYQKQFDLSVFSVADTCFYQSECVYVVKIISARTPYNSGICGTLHCRFFCEQ